MHQVMTRNVVKLSMERAVGRGSRYDEKRKVVWDKSTIAFQMISKKLKIQTHQIYTAKEI